jgi:hypothetical protein
MLPTLQLTPTHFFHFFNFITCCSVKQLETITPNVHSLRTRAEENKILRLKMCKLKKFLSLIVIILNCVIVIETGYFCWFIAENHEKFLIRDLLITLFINFSILFFAVVVIVGVVQSNLSLLGIWILYATLELSRSSIVFYDSWANPDDNVYEKVFISCDVAIQALSIIVVSVLFQVVKLQDNARLKISTIGGSLELSKTNYNQNKKLTKI